jgi:tetratricopeptide (TPR) repeat protein
MPKIICNVRSLILGILGIPLLVVSCGTAPQSMVPKHDPLTLRKEVTHPQAYYHFLKGYLAEINNDGHSALREYQLGLGFDRQSDFLRFRMAKVYFAMGQIEKAFEMAKLIPVERITTAAMLVDLAKIMAGAGEVDLALQLFESGQTRFPQDDQLGLVHGNLLFSMKKYPEAEGVLLQVLEHQPRSAEAHFYLGLIAQETLDTGKAVQHYRQAIEVHAAFERAYVKLIGLWEEEGDLLSAVRLLEKFLAEVNSQHREFRLRLVRFYVLLHQPQKGLAHLDQLLAQHPDDLHARIRKAQLFGEMRNFPEAVEELNNVLRIRPNELRVRDFLGLLYEEMKDYDRAIEAYQTNIKIDPTFFDSVLHLAFVSYRLKRNEDALSYLDQAVKLNPKRTESYLLFGLTYFQMGKYERAKDKLEQGIEQDPSNPELHFNLGTTLDKLDRFEDVVRAMEQTIQLDPDHADALNYLGYSYADRGMNYEEALALTKRAVALKPHNGYYVDSLAWALFKLGRVDEAFEMIQRAVALVSDDPVIFEHLGEILLSREEPEKAREAWLQSLQLDSTNENLKKRFRDAGFGEPIPTLSHQSTLVP